MRRGKHKVLAVCSSVKAPSRFYANLTAHDLRVIAAIELRKDRGEPGHTVQETAEIIALGSQQLHWKL
jgi:hypothetical protein